MSSLSSGPAPIRGAFTLVEILIVATLIGLVTAIAAPRLHAAMDGIAVESAARDVTNAFALARLAALSHGGAVLQIDSVAVSVTAGGHVVHAADIAHAYAVHLHTNVATVRYAATGLGLGVSNGTITVARGASLDSIVVSRLGRVRR